MHTLRPAAAAVWRAAQPVRPSLRPQGSLTRSLPRRPTAALDPAASTAAGSPIIGQLIDLPAARGATHRQQFEGTGPRTRSSKNVLAGRLNPGPRARNGIHARPMNNQPRLAT